MCSCHLVVGQLLDADNPTPPPTAGKPARAPNEPGSHDILPRSLINPWVEKDRSRQVYEGQARSIVRVLNRAISIWFSDSDRGVIKKIISPRSDGGGGGRRRSRGDLVLGSSNPMMAVKGYFRAPRRNHHQQQQAAAALRGDELIYGEESPSAALLAADEVPAVPKGYFAVYVGEEARRFVVPTSYLRQPSFRDLMERAAEEFGFPQATGGIRIPCRGEDFEATVAALEAAAATPARRRRRHSRIGMAAAKLPKAMSL
ncbi:hypothetical protein HU200_043922 [Digitaria exilis]|uniref:Uncharacterized protein n=1 Tax=Digitaria exilis TaxID=1010633 RepID=A0A835EBR6_9POAL|nr:hypothetical protein HU200_043922 [Digitaria exilis]